MQILRFFREYPSRMAEFEVDGTIYESEVRSYGRRSYVTYGDTAKTQRIYLTNEQRLEFLKHFGCEEKFVVGCKYYSEDNYSMWVRNRFDRTNMLRVEVGFAFPVNVKIRKDQYGGEWIRAKGHVFKTFWG